MEPRTDDVVDDLIQGLSGLGSLRVWSVIITIFGDFLRHPGDAIAAPDLARLTLRIGIKPDALRVAIHRLKNDGWITARRSGRNSRYQLSEHGFAESAAARPRIYAASPPETGAQFVLIAPPNARANALPDALKIAAFRPIAPRVYLGPEDPGGLASDFLVLRADAEQTPGWLQTLICPPERMQAYVRLREVLEHTRDRLAIGAPPTNIDAQVLRIMIIHRWRQALLGHADLPSRYFPTGWPGDGCRDLVQSLLRTLPRPDAPNF